MFTISRAGLLAAALTAMALSANATTLIRVTVRNTAPANGTFLTPVWVGFHNGTFDLYDPGSSVSAALERVAEDGDTAAITALFAGSGAGTVQGTLGAAPIAPGASVTFTFELDPLNATNRYFSYASMIIPSNDAFIGNGNPLVFDLFGAGGVFTPFSRTITGAMVNDAGSEVNDELPANTAFFGQAAPNTGVAQGGVVGPHPGFQAAAPGNILGSAMFANANFLAPGYTVAEITFEEVPEPATVGAMGVGLAGLIAGYRRRRRNAQVRA